jgi:hypothetical protein
LDAAATDTIELIEEQSGAIDLSVDRASIRSFL